MHCCNYGKMRKVKLHKNSKTKTFYSHLLSTRCMIAEYVSVSFQVFIFIRGGRKKSIQHSITIHARTPNINFLLNKVTK